MKIFLRKLVLCVFLVSAARPLFGLNNEDIVKLVAADLGEETIIVAVRNDSDPDYDTSAMALLALKEAKVSEAIIQAMLKRANGDGGNSSDSSASEPSAAEKFPDVPREEVMPPEISPEVGKSYFTRINFWYEGDESIGTNYTRGMLVPINTPVTLVDIGRKGFKVQLPSGEKIHIVNVEKYTGESVPSLATRYLADAETNIDAYGEYAAKQIQAGEMRLGMTKDQVILARGYPPAHETPSLQSDRWVYWSSRFVKLTIVFTDGRLTEGRGLY